MFATGPLHRHTLDADDDVRIGGRDDAVAHQIAAEWAGGRSGGGILEAAQADHAGEDVEMQVALGSVAGPWTLPHCRRFSLRQQNRASLEPGIRHASGNVARAFRYLSVSCVLWQS